VDVRTKLPAVLLFVAAACGSTPHPTTESPWSDFDPSAGEAAPWDPSAGEAAPAAR
jgi:hypothetical protein